MKAACIATIMVGFLAAALAGVGWGVCDQTRLAFLFPEGATWTPQRVAAAGAAIASSPIADGDATAIPAADRPVRLDATHADRAELYSRFLLYSAQPEEMLVFKAIGRMRPASGDVDPRLYQYGGAFIYPVAALLRATMGLGWIADGAGAPSRLGFYLSHPTEFAKFYVVGRLTVALWGMVGVWAAWALGARLIDDRAGVLAAIGYTLLPVVIALAHESKPHLPGAVLMMWATVWALRYTDDASARARRMMALCCGLALGMVLTSMWIVLLVGIVECVGPRPGRWRRGAESLLIVLAVYAMTNPYVPINLMRAPAVVMANVEQSRAMYGVHDAWSGLLTTLRHLVEGSALPVVLAGLLAAVWLGRRNWRHAVVLLVPAAVLFVQVALLGANKPGEYGRFLIFPNIVLLVSAAAGVRGVAVRHWAHTLAAGLVLATLLAWPAAEYLARFSIERGPDNSRRTIAETLAAVAARDGVHRVGTLRDPHPYAFPPLDFERWEVLRLPADIARWPRDRSGWPEWLVIPVNGTEGVEVEAVLADGFYRPWPADRAVPEDRAGITWAGKPLVLLRAGEGNHP